MNQELAEVTTHALQVHVKRGLRVAAGFSTARAAPWGVAAAASSAGLMELHAAFGVLLTAFVALRFLQQTGQLATANRMNAREFSCRISRMIYLMLYGMLLLKVLGAAAGFSWREGTLELNWSSLFLASPERGFLACGERFRGELVCGILALCLTRALSASLPAAAAPRHARPSPAQKE